MVSFNLSKEFKSIWEGEDETPVETDSFYSLSSTISLLQDLHHIYTTSNYTSNTYTINIQSQDKTEGAQRATRIITIGNLPKPSVKLKFISRKSRYDYGSEASVTDALKNKINLKNILLNSNANPIRCKDIHGYGCAFCPKQFQETTKLKKHFLEEHNDDDLIEFTCPKLFDHVVKLDITFLNCALCDKDIPKLEELLVHLKSAHNKIVFPDVKNELLPFRFDSKELRCAICPSEFSAFKLLQEHMNTHFGNYMCEICGASFVTDRIRQSHVKRHGDGEYKCDQCDKTFSSEEKRRLHAKRTHLGMGKRNKCKFCEERFTDYWKRMNHMVKEHGMPPIVLKCQACERTFNNQRSLSRHTKKDHLLERRHKCSECDMRFFGITNLKKHMTKHTGLRQFRCDVCLKSYGRKSTLREHMRIHQNDRRFACVHCSQTFVQKCSWRNHMHTKHGEDV